MWKEKVLSARDFIVGKSKLLFPVIVIAVVAVTVTIALNAGNASEEEMPQESQAVQEAAEQGTEPKETMVPMTANEDVEIDTLIETFYNAQASGDEEALRSICDEISDKDMLRYLELAKYTQSYTDLEIYTKPGLEEGTTIAYVYYKVVFDSYEDKIPGYQAHFICADDQGKLYIKRSENSEEVNEYVKTVSVQDDVVEFNNHTNAEYNELMENKPELFVYLKQLGEQVDVAVGEGLAQLAAKQEAAEQAEAASEGSEQEGTQQEGTQQEGTGETAGEEQTAELYAAALTTVNVRGSDSEQADKLGKAAEGTRVQVLEQRMNGWSKVLFEGKEGYIKSEFLQVEESTQSAGSNSETENAGGTDALGTVTATTNVNIRASASENADKIGTLVGGAKAQLISKEGDWCKIKYDGEVGYVKADYVQ